MPRPQGVTIVSLGLILRYVVIHLIANNDSATQQLQEISNETKQKEEEASKLETQII